MVDFYPFGDKHVDGNMNKSPCSTPERVPADTSMNIETVTDPKQLINSQLRKIKSEIASVSDVDEESTFSTQVPNQQFYSKLDDALRHLPRELFIDELLRLCN